MNFDRMRSMEIFLRVVEAGGFTAAAREFGLSQSAVSKSVRALEDHLGANLLNRSTRTVALSDEGAVFYEDARRVIDAIAEAEGRVGKRAAAPSGPLRVTCPVAFGRLVLVPMLSRFLRDHPLIQVDLVMSDTLTDLVGEGIDVAIRIGALADSSLRARRLGEARRGAFAATSYLERAGAPKRPADLARHNCIVFNNRTARPAWRFDGPDGPETVEVGGNFRCNNTEGARAAVILGLGVGYHPDFLFADAIRDGAVVPILEGWEPPPLPVHAVFPAGRYVNSKARAFVEAAAAALPTALRR